VTLPRIPLVLLALGTCAVLAGCGGSEKASAPAATAAIAPAPATAATTPKATPAQASTTSLPPLQAEAASAAAGDIPDNQVFLTLMNASGGYSMKYPEGWVQQGGGAKVTFRDKNNIVRVVVAKSVPSTAARIRAELAALKGTRVESGPRPVTISGAPAFKVVYATVSAPNAVTGKRVTLVVDRYYLSHAGKEAIFDLGTPRGVDNVDAYRLMVESFRWR